MFEKRKSYDTQDILVLVLKILLILGAVAAAIVTAVKLYEKIQSKRMQCLCDCCDEEWDDEFCDCDEERDFAETVAEVTEKEINPTEA